jgi:hypothetical protein
MAFFDDFKMEKKYSEASPPRDWRWSNDDLQLPFQSPPSSKSMPRTLYVVWRNGSVTLFMDPLDIERQVTIMLYSLTESCLCPIFSIRSLRTYTS